MRRGWKFGMMIGAVVGLFNAVVYGFAQDLSLVDAIGTGLFVILI